MRGFGVVTKDDFAETVQLAEAKSQRWREGFSKFQRAIDASVGSHFARAFALAEDSPISNDSTQQRIAFAEDYLSQRASEELEGFLFCWARQRSRGDYQMVREAEAAVRKQASPQLRQLMNRFLQDGKLDRVF